MAFIPKMCAGTSPTWCLNTPSKAILRNVVHVNLLLIDTTSPDDAYEKAIKLGKESEQMYENTDGRQVRVVFRGLRDLNVVPDALEHGAELAFSEEIGVPESELAASLRGKKELAIFLPRQRLQARPNYMPGSVMEAARRCRLY